MEKLDKFSTEEIRDLRDAFRMFDRRSLGFIIMENVREAMKAAGESYVLFFRVPSLNFQLKENI